MESRRASYNQWVSMLLCLAAIPSLNVAQENELLEYYPLEMGNTWIYRHERFPGSDTEVIVEVTGTEVLPNGEEYYALESSEGEIIYQRIDSTQAIVYQYTSASSCISNNSETKFYRIEEIGGNYRFPCFGWYPGGVNTYWDSSDPDNIHFTSNDAGAWANYTRSHTLTRNLGRTYMEESMHPLPDPSNPTPEISRFILLSAQIDGVFWVSIDKELSFPTSFSIQNIFPNPSNSNLSVEYEFSESGNYNFLIFDVVGKTIHKLQIYHSGEGKSGFVWDGVDKKNRPVPSGVYILVGIHGREISTRKFLITK